MGGATVGPSDSSRAWQADQPPSASLEGNGKFWPLEKARAQRFAQGLCRAKGLPGVLSFRSLSAPGASTSPLLWSLLVLSSRQLKRYTQTRG